MINKNQIWLFWLMFFTYTLTLKVPSNNWGDTDQYDYNNLQYDKPLNNSHHNKNHLLASGIGGTAASLAATGYVLRKDIGKNKLKEEDVKFNDAKSQKQLIEGPWQFNDYKEDFHKYIDTYNNIDKYKPVIVYLKSKDGDDVLEQCFGHKSQKQTYFTFKKELDSCNKESFEALQKQMNEVVFLGIFIDIVKKYQTINQTQTTSKTQENMNKDIQQIINELFNNLKKNQEKYNEFSYQSSKNGKKYAKFFKFQRNFKTSSGGNFKKSFNDNFKTSWDGNFKKSSYGNSKNSWGSQSNSSKPTDDFQYTPSSSKNTNPLKQKNSVSIGDLSDDQQGYIDPKVLFTIKKINNKSSIVLYIFEKDQIVKNQLMTPQDQWKKNAKIRMEIDIHLNTSNFNNSQFTFVAMDKNNSIIEQDKTLKKIKFLQLYTYVDKECRWNKDDKIKPLKTVICQFFTPLVKENQ